LRIGFGYDVHRLVAGRALILGGLQIPHDLGLEGHSDADVLTHAVMDALLGALGQGDIGAHFPDTDSVYKDAASLGMLREVREWMAVEGFALNNLDATIVAQAPKLASYIPGMRERLAEVLLCTPNRINIKATTTERLGFCGRGEGMEAFAVVSLVGEKDD
jgi:2-C-methyl-D-erythritol 2,4-cyclodiphosphate synthase